MPNRCRCSEIVWALLVGIAWFPRFSAAEPVVQGSAPAAKAESPAPERLLTVESIEARRKQAEAQTDLDEAAKKRAADLYRQALESLTRAKESARKAEAFKQDTESAADRVRRTQQEIDLLRGKVPALPDLYALPELEQEATKLERSLTELKKNQALADAEPAVRANRRKEVRNLLLSMPQRLAEVDKQLEAPPPSDEPGAVTLARRSELLARRMAIEQEGPALQNELAKYDAEDAVDLVRLRRDLHIQEVAVGQRQYELVDGLVRQKREQAAREAVRRAEEDLIQALPLLKDYATRNRELAEEAQELAGQISTADKELQKARSLLEEIQHQFMQTKNRVESVGLTGSVGALLRKQRISLPDRRKRLHDIGVRRKTTEDARFAVFELDDERTELAKPELILAQILRNAPAEGRSRLEHAASTVLDRKREYLDTLIRNYGAYFDKLIELDTTEQKLVNVTEEFARYVDERVLWIRSGKPLTSGVAWSDSARWIVSPAQWAGVGWRLLEDARENVFGSLIAAAAFAALFGLGNRFRDRVAHVGELAQRSTCTQFALTVRTLLLTVLISGIWPAAALYVSWRLASGANVSEFARAVAYGLRVLAAGMIPAELLRQVCRRRGLAESHFDWPKPCAATLKSHLGCLMLVGLPLLFVTAVLHALDPEHRHDSVERICFLAEALIVSCFLARILRPSSGALHAYIAYHRDGWIDRLKSVWYWLGVASPLALAALAFFGYYYTAQQLTLRMFLMVGLILSLVILRSILLRWLDLRRRCLAMQQARDRRAAAQAASAASDGTKSSHFLPLEGAADLAQLSHQTQRLLTTGAVVAALVGAWFIWVGVFPALGFLDRWPVWTSVAQVTEKVTDGDGQTQTVLRDVVQNTTTADLLLALFIGVITFIAFRNVPGLMEMSVLQRLPLEASVRYAITCLTSYAIVILGTIVACSTIGLRWTQIQWLATALTFGLAFGLQEMFANFVAGLIILFERPIRVGDIVTVDDVTGIVSRVRIRATTITNWDRQEFVVPNKEFITGRLLNWTLSDQVNRIVINLGIAYGSDTERARQLLLKIASEHAAVLRNPAPTATFDGFGDSALNLTLRVFLANFENRLEVQHELNTAIHRSFAAEGIEIPFPQRDLHVRSIDASLKLFQDGTLPPGLVKSDAGTLRRSETSSRPAA